MSAAAGAAEDQRRKRVATGGRLWLLGSELSAIHFRRFLRWVLRCSSVAQPVDAFRSASAGFSAAEVRAADLAESPPLSRIWIPRGGQ